MANLTSIGRRYMAATFLFLGLAIGIVVGFKLGSTGENFGNSISYVFSGKVKKGATVNATLESEQTQKEEKKKGGLFRRNK